MFTAAHKSLFIFCIISTLFSCISPNTSNKFKDYPTIVLHHEPQTYGVRAAASYNHQHKAPQHRLLIQIPLEDFNQIFSLYPQEYELLGNLESFANAHFRSYAQTLPSYHKFILWLHGKIKDDKNFRVPGFKYSFSIFGKTKNEFHDFISTEAARITKERDQKRLQIIASKPHLNNNNKQELCTYLTLLQNQQSILISDVTKHKNTTRIAAIEKTLADKGKSRDYRTDVIQLDHDSTYADVFSCTYGTELDRQLHQELISIRFGTQLLERFFAQDIHIQIICPAIHKIAALSKQERDIQQAFQFSDFCSDLYDCLQYGINITYKTSCALTKGVSNGVVTFLSPQHWHDMMTGMLHLGIFALDELSRQEAIDQAFTSLNLNEFYKQSELNYLHSKAQIDAFKAHAQATLKNLKAMPWDQHLEKGFELGTTLVLDTLALQALGNFASHASKNLARKLADIMSSSGTQEFAIEVAGVGKIMVEEGREAAYRVIDTIKNDVSTCKQQGKSLIQVAQELKLIESSRLKPMGDNIWQSSGGVIYGYDRKFGNTLNHTLAHMTPNLAKKNHTVFSIQKDQIVGLIDEAWAIKGNPVTFDSRAYIVDMKRIIGTDGETALRIVVKEPGTAHLLTAYPVKIKQ